MKIFYFFAKIHCQAHSYTNKENERQE